MMPLSNIVSVREATAPKSINHYNLFRSAEINGSAAPGYSSGQALHADGAAVATARCRRGCRSRGRGCRSKRSRPAASRSAIFGLGLLLVYLTLAAQYESLTLPFIILLSVPLAILGALLAQWGRGLINDVYCQIGLVMLIGLSAKNGILIVEFAEQLRGRGLSIADAAVEAARIRLRPILMTSLAFILGVMPLVVASGAGREARHSVGTAVAGGMLASTFLNLLFIPVLYVVVKSVGAKRDVPSAYGCAGAASRCGHRDRCGAGVSHAMHRAGAGADRARDLRRGDPPRGREEPVGGDRRGRASCAPKGCSLGARSATRLQVNGSVTTTTLNTGVEFEGTTVTPRNQLTASLDVRHADRTRRRRWARRAQAEDAKPRRAGSAPPRPGGRSRWRPPTRT